MGPYFQGGGVNQSLDLVHKNIFLTLPLNNIFLVILKWYLSTNLGGLSRYVYFNKTNFSWLKDLGWLLSFGICSQDFASVYSQTDRQTLPLRDVPVLCTRHLIKPTFYFYFLLRYITSNTKPSTIKLVHYLNILAIVFLSIKSHLFGGLPNIMRSRNLWL